ncbi:MAG TPA: putative Ig domain-containing protein [Candidatus Solibacter sp.]|nr:putative Ig domain-containing protein [Candidatus Solibacter sp.]
MHRSRLLLALTASCFIATAALLLVSCQVYPVHAGQDAQRSGSPQESALVIENESELLDTYPGARYELNFHARGGVPTLHWKLERGAVPEGLRLEEGGLLDGSPGRAGEFQFTISVTDSGKPQQSVQKQFFLRVRSAMTLIWKAAAHVATNRIEGSVEVANTTPDDIDLTFICLAVAAANGRATAIGYQHFVLSRSSTKELPFGESLPSGAYVIHADAIGEVAPKNLIYRERLQTPGALQVQVGP